MIINPLRTPSAAMDFAEKLSNALKENHSIKIKPIKLCHSIAKALYGENSSWNAMLKNYGGASDSSLKPAGLNSIITGRSGVGKSRLIAGGLISSFKPSSLEMKAKVVVDTGRSYEHLSWLNDEFFFHEITDPKGTIPALEGAVHVYEMESINSHEAHEFLSNLQVYLSTLPPTSFDLIIDETLKVSASFLEWALCSFEGDVTITSFGYCFLPPTINEGLFNHKKTNIGYI